MSRVIAIGLDSAEPDVMEPWIKSGKLPTLRRLYEQGVYGRLENYAAYSAETPWTTFATGCTPQRTGYYSPLRFNHHRYQVQTRAAYEYEEYPPFFALGSDYNVICFDLPQVRPLSAPAFHGTQISAWGAHSPQVKKHSNPPELYDQIVEKYGPHPGLHRDYAVCPDLEATMKLEPILRTGIERRALIATDLMQRDDWDLFLTVFGESHAAGHNFWQLSQPDHPLYNQLSPRVDHDPMLRCFQSIDTAIEQIIASAPRDTRVVVFSAHGMGANTMDLPSGTFLPELLHRHCFNGQCALAEGDPNGSLPEPIADMQWNHWERHVWAQKVDSNPLRRFLRRRLPTRILQKIETTLERGSRLLPPLTMAAQGRSLTFQPTIWYEPLWPEMKAFALPSFAEGYVRINLKGREAKGIVEPADYHQVCDELTELIGDLRDARTGVKMAHDIIRTRKDPTDLDPKLPDADLVVVWQDEHSTDVVDSTRYGRIGPVPHYRAGSHRPEGFILASGAEIPAKRQLPAGGHAIDLAPTILELLGAPLPEYLDGKPLSIVQATKPTDSQPSVS